MSENVKLMLISISCGKHCLSDMGGPNYMFYLDFQLIWHQPSNLDTGRNIKDTNDLTGNLTQMHQHRNIQNAVSPHI